LKSDLKGEYGEKNSGNNEKRIKTKMINGAIRLPRFS